MRVLHLIGRLTAIPRNRKKAWPQLSMILCAFVCVLLVRVDVTFLFSVFVYILLDVRIAFGANTFNMFVGSLYADPFMVLVSRACVLHCYPRLLIPNHTQLLSECVTVMRSLWLSAKPTNVQLLSHVH